MVITKTYSKTNSSLFATFLNNCGPFAGKSIIDIGCGSAPLLSIYKIAGLANYTGIDHDNETIVYNTLTMGSEIHKFVCLSATDLAGIQTKRFDIAWCCNLLDRLPMTQVPYALSEIKRVAKLAAISIEDGKSKIWLSLFETMGFVVEYSRYDAEKGIFILDCEK